MGSPSLWGSLASFLASASGIVATYYIAKKVVPWLQAYRNKQEQAELEATRKAVQQENQQANSDSDALDSIEREHDSK